MATFILLKAKTLPLEKAITESDFTPMTYTRRRRSRSLSSPGEQKPILTTPEQQEKNTPNFHTESPEATNTKLHSKA